MFGLTQLGVVHTAISLVAVGAGIVSFVRYKEIAMRTRTGVLYVVATALTCITGFGIFQHGGFGAPHALGILTLLVLAVAIAAERRRLFGGLSRYIAVLGYSTTFFFHMIPAFTETSTRLPFDHPLVSSPDDPGLKAAIGVAFLVFVIGAVLQILQVRAERSLVAAPI